MRTLVVVLTLAIGSACFAQDPDHCKNLNNSSSSNLPESAGCIPLTLAPADGSAARPVWAAATYTSGTGGAAGTLPIMKPHYFEAQIGAFGAYLQPDYGHSVNTNVGVYAVVTGKHLGMEAEGSFMIVNRGGIHENTFAVGPRYQFPSKHATFYVKAQVGVGQFSGDPARNINNQSNLLMTQAGGGVDIKLLSHLKLRVVDFSYQYWPQFYPQGLTPYSISSGLAITF